MKLLLLLITLSLLNCASPGGIGVLYNKKSVVKYVFEHSPAEKAGLLLEDVIADTRKLRGPIGSSCHVVWKRGTVRHEADIIRVDVNTFHRRDFGTFKNK